MRFHRTPTVRPLKAVLRLAVIKAVAVSFALVAGYVSAAVVADLSENPEDIAAADQAAARLLAEHQCSTIGLDRPDMHSAFVRHDGQIRHVSLAEARAVRDGRQPGTLVAVCRSPH